MLPCRCIGTIVDGLSRSVTCMYRYRRDSPQDFTIPGCRLRHIYKLKDLRRSVSCAHNRFHFHLPAFSLP